MANGEHDILLSVRNATKVYPGTRALDAVDFDVYGGAVNVLVGENGAGKSTLMKIIAGVEQPTEGTILIGDEPVRFADTGDASRHGVGIVFQELNLFPNLTVAENIFMAREKTRHGVDIDADSQREIARKLMLRLEHDIGPDTPVSELKVGQQQIVEIAKALSQDAKILIMDEPTSALSAAEVDVLFRVIADLTRRGVGIVYISHRLEELIRLGDYITVLRDGRVTGARAMAGVDIAWIVQNMIGAASKDYAKTELHDFGDEVFRAEHVRLPSPAGGFLVDDVSISARSGEIVGIYGLMGAGRSEFFECVMGHHHHSSGDFFLGGEPLQEPDIAGRIRRGVASIPEDRKTDGLIQIMSIRNNMTLSSLRDFFSRFRLNVNKERDVVHGFVRDLTIKTSSIEHEVSALSGGNQQKVVIGKALMTRPSLLLMDEPSRGIDIGAKAEVFRTMRRLAAEGMAIMFITSDLEEVMSLSDRIVVMSNGRISGEFDPSNADEADIVAASAIGHAPTTTYREIKP